jgi:hypothetical protein
MAYWARSAMRLLATPYLAGDSVYAGNLERAGRGAAGLQFPGNRVIL